LPRWERRESVCDRIRLRDGMPTLSQSDGRRDVRGSAGQSQRVVLHGVALPHLRRNPRLDHSPESHASPRATVRAFPVVTRFSLRHRTGNYMARWPIVVTVLLAELGDKTQLATLLFAADQRTSKIKVFAASAGALVFSSFIAVVVGSQLSNYIAPRTFKVIAGLCFIAIGIWVLFDARS
jgi:putative Ca2+/H+ antiporter (TMEM165/GDT1 family)